MRDPLATSLLALLTVLAPAARASPEESGAEAEIAELRRAGARLPEEVEALGREVAALAEERRPTAEHGRRHPPPPADLGGRSPAELVAMLRDGNANVPCNNRIVDRLKELGRASIPPLIEAVGDEGNPGRGYCAWALACVLTAAEDEGDRGRLALIGCLSARSHYVRTLTASGMSLLKDRRLVRALIQAYDPTSGNFHMTLCERTGEAFDSRTAWRRWWSEHRGEHPPQLGFGEEGQ